MEKKLLALSISAAMLITASIFSQASNNSNISETGDPIVVAKISPADTETYPDFLENNLKPTHTNDDIDPSSTVINKTLSQEELESYRELFLQAEKAVKHNDEKTYLQLVNQLSDYPLLPYLKYQWLIKQLDDEAQIKLFLSLYDDSRYASKLKYRWLFHLAKKRQWTLYNQYYTASSNTKLQCYHLRALYKAGEKDAAIKASRDLWSVGHSQPAACDPIFRQLKKSDLFTTALIWERFGKAMQNNKVSLADYLKNLMPKSQHDTAQLWLNLHRRPDRHIQTLLKQKQTEQSPSIFTDTISRLANKDIDAAIRIWDANKNKYAINEQDYNKVEKKLAFKLAFKHKSGAYERFSQLDHPDTSSKEWRIRIALKEQNWPNVLSAINALNENEKKTEKWQYWQARAFLETGEVAQAEKILTELSQRRDFYGYLAADKMNSMYQLANNPILVSEHEIQSLSQRQPYQMVYELMKLDRKSEARLQWWHALRSLNKNEITIAAKLAQKWQWDEVAIFTIAKVKNWDDIEMRFPLSYSDKIHKNSALQKLNPAIVFGLVRRESAFNEAALSPTGARGLMQIMPQTGKLIAKNLNEKWRGKSSLDNPETNIRYGAFYYQQLLKKFDGNYALALAAYNAGPHRVKKWLPKDESVPADIWIETIPFHETREYVGAVLTYALIYQQRAQTSVLTMNDIIPDVSPASELSSVSNKI